MKDKTKSEIESFLKEFILKMETFDVVFENREKNIQALLDLEITAGERKKHLKELVFEDYISGPNQDTNDKSRLPYWEFGKSIKNKDVYIKISLNKVNESVICISFHLAEFSLKYKYK